MNTSGFGNYGSAVNPGSPWQDTGYGGNGFDPGESTHGFHDARDPWADTTLGDAPTNEMLRVANAFLNGSFPGGPQEATAGPDTPGSKMVNGLVPASAMERSTAAGSAPPGVTPAPPGAAGGDGGPSSGLGGVLGPDDPCTWRPGCGRKARTGDVVPNKDGKRVFALKGHRVTRKGLRCTGPLTKAEAEIVAQAAKQSRHAGARVLAKMAGSPDVVVPAHSVDRGRAVMLWARRVIGRPVGMRQLRAAGVLERIGKGTAA